MTKEALIDKIESLPADKKAKVEEFVDSLYANASAGDSVAAATSLAERLSARRERLLRERGLFDSLPHIRAFRDTGGR